MWEVIHVPETDPELAVLWEEFHTAVNMPSPGLRAWLGVAPTEPDQYLWEPDVDPRELGRRVLEVLEKRRVDLTRADVATIRQAVDLITGWLASPRDVSDGRWRRTLMCLGHDPLQPDSLRGLDAELLRRP